jgi:hypothetical protein
VVASIDLHTFTKASKSPLPRHVRVGERVTKLPSPPPGEGRGEGTFFPSPQMTDLWPSASRNEARKACFLLPLRRFIAIFFPLRSSFLCVAHFTYDPSQIHWITSDPRGPDSTDAFSLTHTPRTPYALSSHSLRSLYAVSAHSLRSFYALNSQLSTLNFAGSPSRQR